MFNPPSLHFAPTLILFRAFENVACLKFFPSSFRPTRPLIPVAKLELPPGTWKYIFHSDIVFITECLCLFVFLCFYVCPHLPLASLPGHQLVPGSPEQARAPCNHCFRLPAKTKNGIRDARIVVHCCPLLSIIVHCCPLLSIIVNLRLVLPCSTLP